MIPPCANSLGDLNDPPDIKVITLAPSRRIQHSYQQGERQL